jgi:hypothetical protein
MRGMEERRKKRREYSRARDGREKEEGERVQ